MIIDLTSVINVLHHFWDVFGILLLTGFTVFLPFICVVASAIKIKESIKSKADNQGDSK
jgi:hypothetical protein